MLRQHSTSGRLRRQIAVAVGATALGGLPLLSGVAGAQTTPPEPPGAIDTSALCANVPEGFDPFAEDDATFEADIACLALSGVTQGTGDGTTFSPGLSVQREQMATFVARLIDVADLLDTGDMITGLEEVPDEGVFTDIAGSTHADNIERLAAAGIVTGGAGGRPDSEYSPGLPVSREQMATFIDRAYNYMSGTTTPPAPADDFFDDDDASVHEAAINAITAAGIAQGTTPGNYSPVNPVNRGQMAAFMNRSLAVVEAEGAIAPVPAPAPADETSDATSADNADGTATLTLTVQTALGYAIPGLTADDLSLTVGDTPRTFTELLGNDAVWSEFVPGNGTYTIDFTRAEPGTSTFTNITAAGVVIHPSLEVTVTNDDIQVPDADNSGVEWVDNQNSTGTMTWTVRDADDAPITGLAADQFTFSDANGDYNVGTLVVENAANWSFEEGENGVYTVVQTDGTPPQLDRTYTDLAVSGVVVEESVLADITVAEG